jgi:hypothetical protein
VRSPDVAVTGRHLLAIFTGTKFATRGGALLRSAASFRNQYQKVTAPSAASRLLRGCRRRTMEWAAILTRLFTCNVVASWWQDSITSAVDRIKPKRRIPRGHGNLLRILMVADAADSTSGFSAGGLDHYPVRVTC